MKQPHTEQMIEHTGGQQNTGNHKKSGASDAGGADRYGGTRAGAEHLEPTEHQSSKAKEQRAETLAEASAVPDADPSQRTANSPSS